MSDASTPSGSTDVNSGDGSERLARRVAAQVGCSRTEATHYIEGGCVSVNGEVVEEPGFRVGAGDVIELLTEARPAALEPVTFLLHKPAGASATDALAMIVPDKHAASDRSGIRFLKRHLSELEMIDPLDSFASGLMVLTQDWRVRRKLVDDSARTETEYIAEVSGELPPDGLSAMQKEIRFNGKLVTHVKASWQNETRLRFALKATDSARLVVHLCEKAGLSLISLRRIRIGRLPVAGLTPAEWRYLAAYERF